ncbi:MAG: response regulator [Elusimicrobiota bacterium]
MAKKILIVEDEPHVVKYLEMFLHDAGFQTVSASDGQTGLELAKREKPDLVILDLMMPKKTGTDFYRKLSRDKELGDTPVIVVSGLAGRDLVVRKPAAVFDKPPDREGLIAAIKKALP